MLQFLKRKQSKERRSKQEKPLSDFLPYKCHWNKNTIITKKNGMIQVIKLTGFSFETADDEDLDIKKNIINSLYKNMAVGNITLYFHTVRKRHSKANKGDSESDNDLVDELKNNNFVGYLNHVWQNRVTKNDSFVNELYITILYEDDKEGAAFIPYLLNKLKSKSNQSAFWDNFHEMHDNLSEMTDRIINTLKDYEPQILEVQETKYGNFCQICEFLSMLVNCGDSSKMLVPNGNIDKYIASNRLYFGKKMLKSDGPTGTKYAGIVSLKEYGPRTNMGLLDIFMQMPFELIITQTFTFSNRTIAINKIQLQQNRMIQAEDKAISQVAEMTHALDMATSGDIAFGEHHLSILCIGESKKILENNLSLAVVELSNCGVQGVKETINLEPCYFGQLPGNHDFIVRKSMIHTLNLAGFASLHNYPSGKKDNNFWGDCVAELDTTSGTPFHFNFHVRDVGHSLIIGPTGAGKTVLMNFLCAKAQKFYPRTFFFDKDKGAEIFIRAIGGVYNIIDPGANCGFNPLQLENTTENRAFLLEWLTLLVTVHGEEITSEDIEILTQAIEGNYRLNKKDRKLSNIVPFLGMKTTGSLASRISMWHGDGSHANIFDNDEDEIDLNVARSFGFEMGQLLGDKLALGPILLYIFHRINISLDGSRTMIVLDEAWALIDNPIFGPKIKDWLKVLRKLNTFVIFATQSVEDAAKSAISSTLIQQTATQIFLPNLKATQIYKTEFMLSQREYNLIKSTNPSTRYFLIKQGLNAVVARINLKGMDDIINILSARVDTVLILDKIIKKHGSDPKKWLSVFYQEIEKLNEKN